MSKEQGVEMKMKVTVYPEVKLGDYKGLKATMLPTEATDEDVDKEIENMRDRNSRLVTVEDREAQMGDTAEIDFEGFVDGVAFEGGKGENYPLELGSGSFIPGFEEQVAGHKSDEEFDVNVTFPEDYAAELAGKDAVFKCKIHEIKSKELPESVHPAHVVELLRPRRGPRHHRRLRHLAGDDEPLRSGTAALFPAAEPPAAGSRPRQYPGHGDESGRHHHPDPKLPAGKLEPEALAAAI